MQWPDCVTLLYVQYISMERDEDELVLRGGPYAQCTEDHCQLQRPSAVYNESTTNSVLIEQCTECPESRGPFAQCTEYPESRGPFVQCSELPAEGQSDSEQCANNGGPNISTTSWYNFERKLSQSKCCIRMLWNWRSNNYCVYMAFFDD
jgi:hypothetical protein